MGEAAGTKKTEHAPSAALESRSQNQSPAPLKPGIYARLLELQRTIGNQQVATLLQHALPRSAQAPTDRQSFAGNSAGLAPAAPQSSGSSTTPPESRAAKWQPSSDLWYFNGAEHKEPLPTQVTLRADTPSSGHFIWSVSEGSDRVEIVDSAHDRANSINVNDNRIQLKSVSGSHGDDDVKVQLAHLATDGVPRGVYEGALGVRTPIGVTRIGEQTSYHNSGAANYPVEPSEGEGGEEDSDVSSEFEVMDEEPGNAIPPATPERLRRKGMTHAANATWGYLTHITYQALDDKEKPIKGFDVNEKWTTGVVNDDATANWPRGPEGAFHATGSTFADQIGGVGAGGTPAPKAPKKKKLGSHKVQHWGQEWYIGSLTVGSGTKVQTNTLQKFQDHATHTKTKSPP